MVFKSNDKLILLKIKYSKKKFYYLNFGIIIQNDKTTIFETISAFYTL